MTGPQIVKTKAGKFRVKYYGANGEMLAVSEVLNSKQAARKNVKAMQLLFEGVRAFVVEKDLTQPRINRIR